MYQTVFVDVDNTLLDFDACARESLETAFRDYGVVCTDEMLRTFHRINDGLWIEVEKTTLTREGLYKLRFPRIFEALGLTLPAAEFETKFRAGLDLCAVAFPDAEPFLRHLCGKYTVCIASNAHQEQQRSRLERAGLLQYADFLCTSEAMGAEKPGRAFFDACFAKIPGAAPERSIMLGDSLTADIQGAKNYGIAAIWLDRKHKNDPGALRPDYIVHDLVEAMEIL